MYARVALAELCLLGQNQNIPILGSFWPQAWPIIFIAINERSHYKDIQYIIPAKVRGNPHIVAMYNRYQGVEGGEIFLNLSKT